MPRQGIAQLDSLANFLLLQVDKETSQLANSLRNASQDSSESFTLRTFECIDLNSLAKEIEDTQKQHLIGAIVDDWLQECPTDEESLTKLFGQYANSRFANIVFQQYPKYLPAPGVPEEDRDPDADRAIEKANQKRAADVKQIALAFSELLQHVALPGEGKHISISDSALAALASDILVEFVRVVREEKLSERELVETLPEILLTQIKDTLVNDGEGDATQVSLAALSKSTVGPLECGYERLTLLLTPNDSDSEELLKAFQEQCETTKSFQAAIDSQFLIREGSDLKPLCLGARLAETYPDVDEASRLHSREDIQWRDLRLEE